MKRISLLIVFLCSFAFAQTPVGTTLVTATITDPHGTPYAGGTYSAKLSVPAGTLLNPITGTLDSTGTFSVSLRPNTWVWTICAKDGSTCFTSTQAVSGTTQSLTSALSGAAVPYYTASITALKIGAGGVTFPDGSNQQTAGGGGGGSSTWGAIGGTIGSQTDLQTALNLKAPLASPTLTGVPTAPTATPDTSSNQIATLSFVLGQASAPADGTPPINGTAARGVSSHFARADHVHPTDTTRAPISSPALVGTPTAPTATAGNNSTQLATTQYADTLGALKAPLASPALTGTPTAPTATPGTNNGQISTTAYADAIALLKAPLASPTFTGTVTMPAPTLNSITGSTQCLHASSSGVVSGTGSDCGAGGGSGTVATGTLGRPAIYSSTGTTVDDSNASVDASAFAGTHWTDKVVAAYTALGAGGGKIIVPDSIADNGAATTPAIPSNVTLEFPGSSSAFVFCNMTTGKYTKIYMRGATLTESGSGCRGIEHLGVTASMQEIDHYLLNGVKVNCNSQADSVGIYTQPSGNSAQDEYDNVAVTGCANTGIWFSGQFAQFHQCMSWGNYVNLKMYKAGSDSNTFYDFKASVPGSGVNVIIWNGAEGGAGQGQGATYFINPTLLNGTVTAMAVIADPSLTVGSTDLRIIGGSPELGGSGATSITIDGLVIKRAGFLYASHAYISYVGLDEADGSASPAALLENGATLYLEDAKGYGATGNTLVQTDATSAVVMGGRHAAQGNVNGVSAYPSYITGQYAWLSGQPILFYNAAVPNTSVGNPVDPPNSASGVISSGTAIDPVYGTVLQIVYNTSVGNRTTNHSWMGAAAITTTGTSSDALGTVLAKSSVDSIIRCGVAHADNFAYSTTPLPAGQWTRIVVFNGLLPSGTAVLMNCFESDGTGATVQFTGLQVSVQPTASTASSWVMSQILTTGAVGSNNYSTDASCAASGTAANPSVVSCGTARQGIVYCDVAASNTTCTVNTTAVGTNSRILITPSGATTDGTLLGKTCNTATTFGAEPLLAAKVNATSFSLNMPTVTTNGACFEWSIVGK